jgi:TRAP transporter TAXI family solute receptor
MNNSTKEEQKSQSIFRSGWEYIEPFARYLLLAAMVLLGLLLLVRFLGLEPPSEFTIATGREGGAYYTFAQQYQERFAEEGVTLNIRPTAGSVEIVQLLNSGEVDAGFLQNTRYTGYDTSNISILAGVFYEALWIFYRQDLDPAPQQISDLKGLNIGIGEDGSGTQAGARVLLTDNGLNSENSMFDTSAPDAAAAKLKAGELDAVMLVAGAAAPLVSDLLTTPGIELMPIHRIGAYTSRYKNVSAVTLSEGTIDLEQNIPDEDKQLLAVSAALVANDDLHPDLARLLLVIAGEVHNQGGLLEKAGEFPAPLYMGLDMNPDAVRYLENGPTGLERYLPLWIASRLERLFFLLLPVALILYPLLRGAPAAVAYFNRYRVKRHYRHLRNLEEEYRGYNIDQLDQAIGELGAFQRELNERVKVPTALLDEYYELRMHTGLTLDNLRARKTSLEAAAD